MPRIYPESSILTRGGDYFDLLNPRAADIKIVDIAHALAHLCRFTGHTRHFYSVAQHSVLAAQLISKTNPELMIEALMHDAAEAYLGDVSRPLKRLLPEYQRIERAVLHTICTAFDIAWPLAPEIKTVDNIMLAWERRDLMREHSVTWEATQGIDIDHLERIEQWSPAEAQARFMEMFDRYYEPRLTSRRAA